MDNRYIKEEGSMDFPMLPYGKRKRLEIIHKNTAPMIPILYMYFMGL